MSEVKGEKRTNAGPTDPGLVIETERQPLVDAFWKIYNKYKKKWIDKPYVSMYMAYYLL